MKFKNYSKYVKTLKQTQQQHLRNWLIGCKYRNRFTQEDTYENKGTDMFFVMVFEIWSIKSLWWKIRVHAGGYIRKGWKTNLFFFPSFVFLLDLKNTSLIYKYHLHLFIWLTQKSPIKQQTNKMSGGDFIKCFESSAILRWSIKKINIYNCTCCHII